MGSTRDDMRKLILNELADRMLKDYYMDIEIKGFTSDECMILAIEKVYDKQNAEYLNMKWLMQKKSKETDSLE